MSAKPAGIEAPVKVAIIGAQGFVGSAFVRHLKGKKQIAQLTEITRASYANHIGERHDVVIHCAGNSRKYFAEDRPFEEFDSSVGIVARSLGDFPAPLQVLISSVDVYRELSSPLTTVESATMQAVSDSHYGFHKFMAEEMVRHHAESFLIFRLAGMVGAGLKKNPVFDLLNSQPLRIHPASKYQYLRTDDVAGICWEMVMQGVRNETFNVCGDGAISIKEIAELLKKPMDLSLLPEDATPRIVDINIEKIKSRHPIPQTPASLLSFANEIRANS